jgi:hypothetical protein
MGDEKHARIKCKAVFEYVFGKPVREQLFPNFCWREYRRKNVSYLSSRAEISPYTAQTVEDWPYHEWRRN